MRFNLWFEDECEETDVDIGALLRWLGDLNFDYHGLVDVTIKEAHV